MCAQKMELRMKLSDRMQVIADHVDPGERVADIGTDHGQIPVWLFAHEISPRVILSDISEGSIRKAMETAAAYQFGNEVSFRTGDGLEVLAPGEADTVIIAGMGGKLIRQILSDDPAHTRSFRKFILQPRKGSGPLRKWLLQNGFLIICEDVVRESHFIPEIITAVRPYQEKDPVVRDLAAGQRQQIQDLDEQDIHLRVPPWILQAQGPLEDYLMLRIGQEELILDNLSRAKEPNPLLEEKTTDNIRYLQDLLEQIR